MGEPNHEFCLGSHRRPASEELGNLVDPLHKGTGTCPICGKSMELGVTRCSCQRIPHVNSRLCAESLPVAGRSSLKSRASCADNVVMRWTVVLEYPNGRWHTTRVNREVEPGAEFELYGRRWQAVGPVFDWQTRNQAKREDAPGPMLCTSLGKTA